MLDHGGGPLSAAAQAELESDHLEENPPDDDVAVDILMFAEPASTATELGSAVVENAVKFLQIPLREDAGVNQDSAGHIRSFFLTGLKWSAELWDHWIDKHPQSKVIKPEWCAAFGSYCVHKAYEEAGKALPAKLSASASDLGALFIAAGRFLGREELFRDDGPVRPQAKVLPGPGDLVVFHAHVGMLRELYADGTFITIEGNTYKGHPRNDGVYQCSRSSAQKKADGTFSLVGFCLLPSIDGIVGAYGKDARKDAPPADESASDAAEIAEEPEPPPAAS